MDPELEAMIRAYLSAGADPFAPQIPDYSLGGAQMSFDEDGLPDYQKTSDVKNQLAIMSDPAFLATFADAPGGFRMQDFQGTTTYEPVKAAGYMRMQQYLNSSDPVSRYIAEVINDGGTANQAETELRQIANTPNHPLYAEITPYIQSYDDMGEPKQDWNRVRQIASSLENDVLYDPQFDAFDPDTGLPARARTEETEAMRYFREAGLPMPNERYGMETTNPENYERMLEARGGIAGAKQAAETARGERDAGREAMLRMIEERSAAQPQPAAAQSPTSSGGSGGVSGFLGDAGSALGDLAGSYVPDFGGIEMPDMGGIGKAAKGLWEGWNNSPESELRPERTSPLTPRVKSHIQSLSPSQKAEAASQLRSLMGEGFARIGMGDARINRQKEEIKDASRRMLAAQRDARDRNLGLGKYEGTRDTADFVIARRLAEAGRTPLNDTLQARRQAMARFGIRT